MHASSSNNFAVSTAAAGPWRYFVGNGTWPWAARASAAVVSGPGMTSVIVGSGMTFTDGVAQGPVFSDVWQVDAGVCVLSQLNNKLCAGYGAVNLATVSCTCDPNSNVSPYCDQCNTAGTWGLPTCANTCPTGAAGFCNSNTAGPTPSGVCNAESGCVCATGWTNGGASPCDTCAPGYFGPSCLPCTCNPAGNAGPTPCDGSGNGPPRTGSGTCTSCLNGYGGANCLSSPFTQLTPSFLNVADPADGFGPEDKLVACKGDLVFVDLDNAAGTLFKYTTLTSTWSTQPIATTVCNGGASPPMWPRDAGYVVAVTQNPTPDRLVVLGGDPADVNVWFSDDCGATWQCSNTPQAWVPRQYAATVDAAGILAGNPLVFAGGVQVVESVAQFHSPDGGVTWSRPACTAASPCQQDCQATGNIECTLPIPDPVGSCAGDNPNYNLCYLLPDQPCFPGAVAVDW